MTENSRPFDLLNSAKGKTVLVELKNSRSISGKLVAFDMYVNLTIENAEEQKDSETIRKLGNVFIKGDTVVFVSPTL